MDLGLGRFTFAGKVDSKENCFNRYYFIFVLILLLVLVSSPILGDFLSDISRCYKSFNGARLFSFNIQFHYLDK